MDRFQSGWGGCHGKFEGLFYRAVYANRGSGSVLSKEVSCPNQLHMVPNLKGLRRQPADDNDLATVVGQSSMKLKINEFKCHGQA